MWKPTRRDVLKLAMRGIPPLLLQSNLAHALTDDAAHATHSARFIYFWTPLGTLADYFFPTIADGSSERALLSGGLPLLLAPLDRHVSKLCIPIGLDAIAFSGKDSHDRSSGTHLTGRPLFEADARETDGRKLVVGGGESLDQFLGRHSPGFPISTLTLGVRSQSQPNGSVRSTLSYTGVGHGVPFVSDPRNTYLDLFSTGAQSSQDTGRREVRLAAIAQVRENNRHFVDKFGRKAAAQLEAHLESLTQLESKLFAPPPHGCAIADFASIERRGRAGLPEAAELQLDLLVTALACGLSRVATFMWDYATSSVVFKWLPDQELGMHEITHTAADYHNAQYESQHLHVAQWLAKLFASLLERLDESLGEEQTLSENTIVVWGSGEGDGWKHDGRRLPIVIADGTGRFKRGVALRTPAPHPHLLTSLAQACGHPWLTHFGDDVFAGALDSLWT